ncbi:hypothetical protein ACFFLM_00430 [Deinococcus oregonensis]|uniref:Uncharacterized protein n=1 Tax=Deinococcus oregonensis TaxID=1805970 RepID=A0ABV6AWB9_9DEIO
MNLLLKDQKFRSLTILGSITFLVFLLWKPSFAPGVLGLVLAAMLLFWANNYAQYTARHRALLGAVAVATLGIILLAFGNARQNDLNQFNLVGKETRDYCASQNDSKSCLDQSRTMRAEITAIAQGKHRGQFISSPKEILLLAGKRGATVSSAIIPAKSEFYDQISASIGVLPFDSPNIEQIDLSLSDSFSLIIYNPTRPLDFYFGNTVKLADVNGLVYYSSQGNRLTNFIVYQTPDKSKFVATTPKLMRLTQPLNYISLLEAQRKQQ